MRTLAQGSGRLGVNSPGAIFTLNKWPTGTKVSMPSLSGRRGLTVSAATEALRRSLLNNSVPDAGARNSTARGIKMTNHANESIEQLKLQDSRRCRNVARCQTDISP